MAGCADRGRLNAQKIASQQRINRGWSFAVALPAIFICVFSLEQMRNKRG